MLYSLVHFTICLESVTSFYDSIMVKLRYKTFRTYKLKQGHNLFVENFNHHYNLLNSNKLQTFDFSRIQTLIGFVYFGKNVQKEDILHNQITELMSSCFQHFESLTRLINFCTFIGIVNKAETAVISQGLGIRSRLLKFNLKTSFSAKIKRNF